MTSTAPSTKRLESSTPSETAIRWPTTELLLRSARTAQTRWTRHCAPVRQRANTVEHGPGRIDEAVAFARQRLSRGCLLFRRIRELAGFIRELAPLPQLVLGPSKDLFNTTRSPCWPDRRAVVA